mmetsp:Transcript_50549/g.115598  ORF Transcript_50549/g.115598 Transcript_50549/m.115598 type:complete len:245 (-) Transcript_50549:696-1430(-)
MRRYSASNASFSNLTCTSSPYSNLRFVTTSLKSMITLYSDSIQDKYFASKPCLPASGFSNDWLSMALRTSWSLSKTSFVRSPSCMATNGSHCLARWGANASPNSSTLRLSGTASAPQSLAFETRLAHTSRATWSLQLTSTTSSSRPGSVEVLPASSLANLPGIHSSPSLSSRRRARPRAFNWWLTMTRLSGGRLTWTSPFSTACSCPDTLTLTLPLHSAVSPSAKTSPTHQAPPTLTSTVSPSP